MSNLSAQMLVPVCVVTCVQLCVCDEVMVSESSYQLESEDQVHFLLGPEPWRYKSFFVRPLP